MHNQLWIKKEKGNVEVGFTEDFSKNVLSEAYQVLVVSQKPKYGRPFISIETNDGFITVRTPKELDGLFVHHLDGFGRDCPDRIGTRPVVFLSKIPAVPKEKQRPQVTLDDFARFAADGRAMLQAIAGRVDGVDRRAQAADAWPGRPFANPVVFNDPLRVQEAHAAQQREVWDDINPVRDEGQE